MKACEGNRVEVLDLIPNPKMVRQGFASAARFGSVDVVKKLLPVIIIFGFFGNVKGVQTYIL
jgi:hypothetical protein